MNPRPRVVHIVSSLSTYGAERLVGALAERFPADEFDVRVVTIYRSARGIPDGLRHRVTEVARRGRYDAGFFARLVNTLKALDPQIVHTHTHNGKFWGRLAALAAGVPTIVHTEHNGDYPREMLPAHLMNRFLHARTTAFVGFSRGHADRIARLEHIPRDRFHVIPNGVLDEPPRYDRDRTRREAGVDDDRAIVLRAARFEPSKNHALAVDAWARNPELRSRAVLVFAGAGAEEERIRARAWGLGLADDVRFLGFRSDVPELLGGVDAMLMSSAWGEAMPLIAIEAMRAGVPIVSTPWEGAHEFFDEGRLGIVAERHDADDLARAVIATLDDREAAAQRTTAARAIGTTRYSVDACIAGHAALYRSLLNAPADVGDTESIAVTAG